jgi:hypothetical protein
MGDGVTSRTNAVKKSALPPRGWSLAEWWAPNVGPDANPNERLPWKFSQEGPFAADGRAAFGESP